MYAERFKPLIRSHPLDADALTRVAEYFGNKERSAGDRFSEIKLDPQRLFDITQAGSATRLARVIELLVSERLLERLVVVQSPNGSGLASYSSFTEIPSELHDATRDVMMSVTPESVKVLYRPAK